MSTAHLHLVLNHLPILGTLFGVLLLGYGLVRRQDAVVRASLWFFILGGAAAAGAYLTGEGAEEAVEGLAGVSQTLIEAHEQAAFYALVLAGLLGVLALSTAFLSRQTLVRPLVFSVLFLGMGTSGLMTWTGNLGGQIRHTAIRSDAAGWVGGEQPSSDAGGDAAEGHAADDDD